ncbi:MAG: HlyD family efflux transporter periplasmic adaptor subunit [Wenzhouxiangellaceae bacterium]
MDIQRNVPAVRRWRRTAIVAGLGLGFVVLMGAALWMGQRPPAVDGDSIWTGVVTRGELVHEVVAPGRLVATDVRAVTNRSAGVVEQLTVLPGDRVEAGDVLLVMTSPGIDEDLAAARWDLAGTRADQALARVESQNRRLDLEAQVASAEADYTSTKMELEAQEQLGEGQVFSALEVERTRLKAAQLEKRMQAERARLDRYDEVQQAEHEAAEAQLAALEDRVARLEALRDDLKVKASMAGVVLEITPEEGQQLSAGTAVARIVNLERLIARVSVDERSAARVQPGLRVSLELGRERLQGDVLRVDPGVENRLVSVDVALPDDVGDLDLRPDLSVTARIELDRIDDTLKLDRPAQMAKSPGPVRLFRLGPDGKRAHRVEVELGRASMREVEIIQGLSPGDRIILADMSGWLDQEQIRIR